MFAGLRGLWLLFYYLAKRENDSTILAGREYDFTIRDVRNVRVWLRNGTVTSLYKLGYNIYSRA